MKGEPIQRGLLVFGVLLAGCGAPAPKTPELRPLVVQGAMPEETTALVGRLEGVVEERVAGWTFWRGAVDGYPVIVSKTRKGMSNAAAATAIAAQRYRPAAIINQGTAGGHVPELHVYDIVLGRTAVHLGAFRTGFRELGQGSDPLEWRPIDLMASEGSSAQNPAAESARSFRADRRLLAAAESVAHRYRQGRVVVGVIGTSEIWNSELDRIRRFNAAHQTAVEEMETAAAAQVAGQFQIPFLGIRVLSNNIVNDEPYEPKTGAACQQYVYEVVQAAIDRLRDR